MENGDIIKLVDENDNEVEFDLLMTFDYEGKRYVALLPMEEVEGVENDEVLILEVVRNKGNESYKQIENPILLDEVFNEFQELFDEQFDDEEEE